jgi:uncharacterized transporter YbjL
MNWMDRIRSGVPPVILVAVVAVSTYWIFYGSSRDLNVIAAIILALGLFSVRKHYRVSYGVIEIGFSVFILIYNWRQGRGAFSSAFSSGFDISVWQIILLQTFTAIYISIRGMDNISEGSKEGRATHCAVAYAHGVCRWVLAFL